MLPYSDTISLIKLAQEGDEEAKQKLIEENSPLVKSVIKRFKGKGIEYDDLYQLGCVGFLKAIKNFKTEYNVKFSTYAVPMVIGEIKRFMRDDGEIKVSRAIKSLNLKISKFIESFVKEHMRKPTTKEIAAEFQIDESEVVFTMDSSKMPISMYTTLDDDSSHSQFLIDRFMQAGENDDSVIDNISLKEALSSLDERDKKIVLLRFFRDKTQSEIASVLNISQVQVSRLECKIIEKMREKLKENIWEIYARACGVRTPERAFKALSPRGKPRGSHILV